MNIGDGVKPKVLVINIPYEFDNLAHSYKYNLYYELTSDIYSDNLRILLKIFKLRNNGILVGTTVDQWKLIQHYYG